MKRFHVHVHVKDLPASIAFYNRLFDAQPARVEADYAKWMLEDPRVNFAISTRGDKPGLDHLGFQTDTAEELGALRQRAEQAEMAAIDEGETTCCYAKSEKHWVVDPQGIAWEHFHTLGNIPVFKEGASASQPPCCTPGATPTATPTATSTAASTATPAPVPSVAASACCSPATPGRSAPATRCCSPSPSKTSCC